jgi:hypothetical protein
MRRRNVDGFRSRYVRLFRAIGLTFTGILLKVALALGAVFLASGCDPPDSSSRSESTRLDSGGGGSPSPGPGGSPSPGSAGILDASWTAPTTNADESSLTDLASYRVYYGTTSTPCPGPSFFQVASQTPSPQINEAVTFRLTGLSTGAQYSIAITAVDSGGLESACSAVASAVARSAGNAADQPVGYPANTWASGVTPFAIGLPVSTLTGLTAELVPHLARPTVTFTAIATGGTVPYQFKWWLWDGATWTVLKDWSTGNTFAWTPSTPNPNYAVGVWIRSTGNTADQPDGYPANTGAYRAIAFAID